MKYATFALSLLLSVSMFGCSNTAEGLKEDTHQDSIKASEGLKNGIDSASNTMADASNKVKETTSNAALTLRIKNAINADAGLNDSGNQIDVSTEESKVSLNGHVTSAELKQKAQKVASEELQKSKASQHVENNLSITSK